MFFQKRCREALFLLHSSGQCRSKQATMEASERCPSGDAGFGGPSVAGASRSWRLRRMTICAAAAALVLGLICVALQGSTQNSSRVRSESLLSTGSVGGFDSWLSSLGGSSLAAHSGAPASGPRVVAKRASTGSSRSGSGWSTDSLRGWALHDQEQNLGDTDEMKSTAKGESAPATHTVGSWMSGLLRGGGNLAGTHG